MPPFSRILVDIDAAATSHPALERAARLARGCGARLTVVDVVAPPFGTPQLAGSPIEREWVSRRHDQLSHLVASSGVTAKVAVLRGEPGEVLTREAIRGGYDLVVRSHVRDVVSPKPSGPVGRQLFRHCPCPVWAVGPGAVPVAPRIVCAMQTALADADERQINLKLIDLALFLTDIERGSLVLLDVWQPFGAARVLTHATDDNFLAYPDASERLTGDQFKELRDAYDGGLADVRLELRKGEPMDVIPEYVVAHGIDTIVTGTMARTGLTRLLFSDVAEGRRRRRTSAQAIMPNNGAVTSRINALLASNCMSASARCPAHAGRARSQQVETDAPCSTT